MLGSFDAKYATATPVVGQTKTGHDDRVAAVQTYTHNIYAISDAGASNWWGFRVVLNYPQLFGIGVHRLVTHPLLFGKGGYT